MKKRHLNNSSIAHNTLYYLQKGPDVTSIPISTRRHTGGGLRCIKEDYIKEMNPSRKGVGTRELEQVGEIINL